LYFFARPGQPGLNPKRSRFSKLDLLAFNLDLPLYGKLSTNQLSSDASAPARPFSPFLEATVLVPREESRVSSLLLTRMTGIGLFRVLESLNS
jgi:hypothetical protein